MEKYMWVNGNKTKWKALVIQFGMIRENTKENLVEIKGMDKENLLGKMEGNTEEGGLMGNNMEQDGFNNQREKKK